MKNYILILLLSTITLNCKAQNKYVEGKTKGKHDTFFVHRSKYIFNNQQKVVIYSTKNKYNNGVPRAKNELELAPHEVTVDKEAVKKIVFDVLKNKLQELHARQETISVLFTFETTGILTDLIFSINENSMITPAEIETIDNRLRAEIHVSFNGPSHQTHIAVGANIPTIKF